VRSCEFESEALGLQPESEKDLAKLKQKLATLKQDIRALKEKPELIAMSAADITVTRVPKADPTGRKSSNSNGSPPPNLVSSPSILAFVEISPPTTPPKSQARLS
jgi:hypothetical protein